MKKRVITGFFMGVVFIPILILGGWAMTTLAVILSYLATYELVRMHNTNKDVPALYNFIIPVFSVMLVLLGALKTHFPDTFNTGDMVFTTITIFVLFLCVSLFNNKLKTSDFLMYFGFILYGGLGIYMATRLRYIDIINESFNTWFGLILMGYVLLTTVFTDMGAYNVGILLGKHKLCPSISPKKTIEGSIGGSFFGTLVGSLFLILAEKSLSFQLLNVKSQILHILIIVLISFILTISAQIGDLVASKLKREYNIKDYGKIFPGHGGVMDRFDSLIVTSTFFILFLIIIGVIPL